MNQTATQHADGYTVGAIVDSSWGYDQTNIDFYQIVKRTGKTLWLQPLGSRAVHTTDMTGTVTPGTPKSLGDFDCGYPGCKYDGKLLRRTLKFYKDGRPAGLAIKHGWASLYDGEAKGFSTYA